MYGVIPSSLPCGVVRSVRARTSSPFSPSLARGLTRGRGFQARFVVLLRRRILLRVHVSVGSQLLQAQGRYSWVLIAMHIPVFKHVVLSVVWVMLN